MIDRHKTKPFIPSALLILVALYVGFLPIPSDPDLWFHLADGESILKHQSVPQTDPFSFTKGGELWVPHSWLFDVGAALGRRHIGPRATEGVMAVVFMLAIVVSFRMLTARGARPMWAAVICVMLAVAAGNTRGIRPQVFTLLFCNLVILLLVRHRHHPRQRLIAYLPFVFLLWAQVHSACVMGLVVVSVWLAGRTFEALMARSLAAHARELAAIAVGLVLSVGAVLITPHRITHFEYLALTMKLRTLKHTISEWQAPDLLALAVPDVYIYLLVAGVVVLLARWARRVGWAELAVCVALTLLGLTAIRHIPLACVASVPLIAEVLATRKSHSPDTIRRSVPQVVGLCAAGLALLLGLWRYPVDIESRYLREEPVNGVCALARLDKPLRVFTTYNTGSYVLWAGRGRLSVFVDSRADVYGDDILTDAYNAMNGHGWDDLFERWEVEAVVVQRWNPLAGILSESDDWTLLAEDTSALTFVGTVSRSGVTSP